MTDADVVIRPPTAPEQRRCESLIREAFWDVYRPGCIEHLIWRRAMAGHPDALPHLILVADRGGDLLGCTMSTRAWVEAPDGLSRTPVVGVGPIGVVPGEQRRGIGSRLMEATMDRARRDGERGGPSLRRSGLLRPLRLPGGLPVGRDDGGGRQLPGLLLLLGQDISQELINIWIIRNQYLN